MFEYFFGEKEKIVEKKEEGNEEENGKTVVVNTVRKEVVTDKENNVKITKNTKTKVINFIEENESRIIQVPSTEKGQVRKLKDYYNKLIDERKKESDEKNKSNGPTLSELASVSSISTINLLASKSTLSLVKDNSTSVKDGLSEKSCNLSCSIQSGSDCDLNSECKCSDATESSVKSECPCSVKSECPCSVKSECSCSVKSECSCSVKSECPCSVKSECPCSVKSECSSSVKSECPCSVKLLISKTSSETASQDSENASPTSKSKNCNESSETNQITECSISGSCGCKTDNSKSYENEQPISECILDDSNIGSCKLRELGLSSVQLETETGVAPLKEEEEDMSCTILDNLERNHLLSSESKLADSHTSFILENIPSQIINTDLRENDSGYDLLYQHKIGEDSEDLSSRFSESKMAKRVGPLPQEMLDQLKKIDILGEDSEKDEGSVRVQINESLEVEPLEIEIPKKSKIFSRKKILSNDNMKDSFSSKSFAINSKSQLHQPGESSSFIEKRKKNKTIEEDNEEIDRIFDMSKKEELENKKMELEEDLNEVKSILNKEFKKDNNKFDKLKSETSYKIEHIESKLNKRHKLLENQLLKMEGYQKELEILMLSMSGIMTAVETECIEEKAATAPLSKLVKEVNKLNLRIRKREKEMFP